MKDTVVPKEESKVTGEQESESIGTVTTIVTETYDNTQPYGVEIYETQSTETKVVDVKDIAKGILSGVVMAGIGMLIAGALTIVGAATPVAAVATAVITGFSGAYVNAELEHCDARIKNGHRK